MGMGLNTPANVQQRLTDLTGPGDYSLCLVTSRRVPTGDATFPNYLVAGALYPSGRTDWSNVYGPVWELWNTAIFKCAPWPGGSMARRSRVAHWYEEAEYGLAGQGAHYWFRTAALTIAPDGELVWVDSVDLAEQASRWGRSGSREQLFEIDRGRTVIQWAVTCSVHQVTVDADYTIAWAGSTEL